MSLEFVLFIVVFIYLIMGMIVQTSYAQIVKTILIPIIKYPKTRILRFLWILSLPSLIFATIFLNIVIIMICIMLLPFVLIALLVQMILNSKLFGKFADYFGSKINKLKINKIIKWLTEEV